MKKLFSLLLILGMVCSLSVTASAITDDITMLAFSGSEPDALAVTTDGGPEPDTLTAQDAENSDSAPPSADDTSPAPDSDVTETDDPTTVVIGVTAAGSSFSQSSDNWWIAFDSIAPVYQSGDNSVSIVTSRLYKDYGHTVEYTDPVLSPTVPYVFSITLRNPVANDHSTVFQIDPNTCNIRVTGWGIELPAAFINAENRTGEENDAVEIYYVAGPFGYPVLVDPPANGTVTANKDWGGQNETMALTVAPNSGYTLDTLTVRDRDGNGIPIADSNTFVMPASSVTVTATFREVHAAPDTCTVTFSANGHGTAPMPQTVETGKTAAKPAELTGTGWSFGGWYTEAECINAFDFSTPITADLTLYAKWTEDGEETPALTACTVTFDANGHGTAPAAQTVEAGKTVTKPADPTASGWSFDGWYTEKEGKNAFDFSTPVTGSRTLYARWTQNSGSGRTPGLPDTGDASRPGLWLALTAVSAGGIAGLAVYSRKRRMDDRTA